MLPINSHACWSSVITSKDRYLPRVRCNVPLSAKKRAGRESSECPTRHVFTWTAATSALSQCCPITKLGTSDEILREKLLPSPAVMYCGKRRCTHFGQQIATGPIMPKLPNAAPKRIRSYCACTITCNSRSCQSSILRTNLQEPQTQPPPKPLPAQPVSAFQTHLQAPFSSSSSVSCSNAMALPL